MSSSVYDGGGAEDYTADVGGLPAMLQPISISALGEAFGGIGRWDVVYASVIPSRRTLVGERVDRRHSANDLC